jgi:hypothetical protein
MTLEVSKCILTDSHVSRLPQNELVLAVGGFDHAYGGIRLVSYDKKASQSDNAIVNGVPF